MAERRDVIKNKKAILQGYIDMTSEKMIDKITVSDVIKKANVSRATFYAHYKDINALKDQFETDFMQMMIQLNVDSIHRLFKDTEQSVYNIFLTCIPMTDKISLFLNFHFYDHILYIQPNIQMDINNYL